MATVNRTLRIIFMGTPEFAVATLNKIHKGKHTVAAVVTVPDKPAGRGKKLRASAVKEYAIQNDLPLLQPEKMKDPVFLDALKNYQADLFVIVAFRMLPEVVWAMPPLGTFNLHASLLPQYRGAAPINHAIINGEKQSGVTTFFIDKKIDTGKIIMQKTVSISEEDSAGDLHDKLMLIGADLVLETIDKIALGTVKEIAQEDLISETQELKPAPKIFKEDCRINWQKPVADIHNLIRGLSPYPAAFTQLKTEDGKIMNLKIFASVVYSRNENNGEAGKFLTDSEHFLRVICTDGVIEIKELQLEGKKKMNTGDFLKGFRKINNSILISK